MFKNKQIKFNEAASQQVPFVHYDRRQRDRLLLQMGYHNPVEREICHLSCEWIASTGKAICNIDQIFFDYLEQNIHTQKLINTKNEFFKLIKKMQNDKMVILFEDQQTHEVDSFVITGEQLDRQNQVYQFYKIEKAYQSIEGNPDIILPKGKKALSDHIIELPELGQKMTEDNSLPENIILNIKVGPNHYIYLPANHLNNFHQIVRNVIRNNLLFKNTEFLSYLAQSLKMDLSQVRKKLNNEQDETFWMLLDKKFQEAKDRYLRAKSEQTISTDLQTAVFMNRIYLKYQTDQKQHQYEAAARVNKLAQAIEKKLSEQNIVISEKQFDNYYQKIVSKMADSEELISYLDKLKAGSLRNDIEKESDYQLLFLGNNPDLNKNFVLHKRSLYLLFKKHLENSSFKLKDHITSIFVQFLIYSSCDLSALKNTPFYNLEEYREHLLKKTAEIDPFLAEVIKRPKLILLSLMSQNISIEQKQDFLELFFSKSSGEFLPLDNLLDLKLPELLRTIYKQRDEDNRRIIPWWRRVFLLITKKKSFIFQEVDRINKNIRRNLGQASSYRDHDDFVRYEHNIRPNLSETSIVYGTTKSLSPVKKEPKKPQNLDEATEQLRQILENDKKHRNNPF